MKKNMIATIGVLTLLMVSCKQKEEKQEEMAGAEETAIEVEAPAAAKIIPIEHATAIIEWDDHTIYIDPVGGKAIFEGQKSPDIIFITDIHGDHFNPETLKELDLEGVQIIAPDAVKQQMEEALSSKTTTMVNGETQEIAGFSVEATPMYN
ncbi:MAG: MBL fold metallo-hydrolase, partial [Flavobacteriaceae bacterium]|nr:MBL fold metallo-hydrolase [Flavobacteriaceae bacterium]